MGHPWNIFSHKVWGWLCPSSRCLSSLSIANIVGFTKCRKGLDILNFLCQQYPSFMPRSKNVANRLSCYFFFKSLIISILPCFFLVACAGDEILNKSTYHAVLRSPVVNFCLLGIWLPPITVISRTACHFFLKHLTITIFICLWPRLRAVSSTVSCINTLWNKFLVAQYNNILPALLQFKSCIFGSVLLLMFLIYNLKLHSISPLNIISTNYFPFM